MMKALGIALIAVAVLAAIAVPAVQAHQTAAAHASEVAWLKARIAQYKQIIDETCAVME